MSAAADKRGRHSLLPLLVADLTSEGQRRAADAAGVPVEWLLAWARGDGRPTPAQAAAMERATCGALRMEDWG